jgi:hypothetical protein
MQALVDTVMIMGLVCGGIATLYIGYALLWLPLYLMGKRHPDMTEK